MNNKRQNADLGMRNMDLRKTKLNERQIKAVMYVKEKRKITNKEYQELTQVSKPTATRELSDLVGKEIIEQQGVTGKGTYYTLKMGSQTAQRAHNGLTNGSEKDDETQKPQETSNKGTKRTG